MRVLPLCFLFYTVVADLYDQLHYFETLHHVDVKVRRKRSADGHDTRDVSFPAFGKEFNMVLSPGSPVITADFKAKLMYKDGHTVPLYINNNNFFTGHLADNESIKIDALTEDGLWTVNIFETKEIYTLEPSWRHLPPSNNHTMIVYRHSDIKWDNIFPDLNETSHEKKIFCPGIHPKNEHDNNAGVDQKEAKSGTSEKSYARFRRAAPHQNTCHIIAVADYTLFYGPGGGFPHRTANYIIQNLQKVDRIYRNTVWDSETGLTGLGLQIKELRIHPELTDPNNYARNGRHYNMFDRNTHWPYDELLEQFGEDSDIDKFCLAHLFTHRRFSGGVLGLAYIAPSKKFGSGGICSIRSYAGKAYNTGFSSSMNTKGNHLLTQEAMLVTAHEFGHNWGAEHDAETKECAPSGFNNGRFIMYPYAVSGYDENNNKFSPCSKRYISSALIVRSEVCFKAEETRRESAVSNVPLCGNGFIDKDEDCDGGGMGLSGQDPCCSASCKFIGNASCSAINFECCKGCRLAAFNTACRGASRELCEEAAYCTGFSLECPESKPVKDNTPCIDQGNCFNGECLDYCTYAGTLLNKTLKPCRCEDVENSCLRCCRSASGECKPLNNSNHDSFLQDGRPCNYGYCEGGRCQRVSSDMIQRLFDFIEHLDSSTFVAFMRSNIVGTVIVFSLVLWIPLSWTISCIDKRKEKKSKEKLSEEALLSQSLQAAGFAKHFKDYNVKESKFRHTIRAENLWPPDIGGASYKPNYSTEIDSEPEPRIFETAI